MEWRPVTVAETPEFVRQAEAILPFESREALILFLAFNPEAGSVIPGTGGIRKLRWAMPGTGKSGGARIIYYFHNETLPLYLLMAYAKNRKTDLTKDEERALRKIAEAIHHPLTRNARR